MLGSALHSFAKSFAPCAKVIVSSIAFPAAWNQVRVLLLDIEGTTTPIDFVYKTLFPYAARNVERFLRDEFQCQRNLVEELQKQNQADRAAGLAPRPWLADTSASSEAQLQSCVAYVRWLMERDSKCTPLKTLQGKIWQRGFESGELHGEVYADVPRAFDRWRRQGREIAIYSSGSVQAQKLLFSTTSSEDLTPWISGFFDTEVGAKTEAESYTKIAAAMNGLTGEFLFLSDAEKEVRAARSAGMFAALCDRSLPRSPAPTPKSDDAVTTFDEVFPD